MFSFIPELDIAKAVSDNNIDSSASRVRVSAFTEISKLIAQKDYPAEMIIEGILYEKITSRLKPEHRQFFEELYIIDKSAVGVTGYDITKAIKFIASNKIKLPQRKVIIVTDNHNKYSELAQDHSIRVYSPQDVIKKITFAKKIIENFGSSATYDTRYSALITSFFMPPN